MIRALLLLCICLVHAPCAFSGTRDGAPIDIVYTWVDGDDPLWQQSLQQTVGQYTLAVVKDAQCKSRFRSRDELKYSLRSIWKYAHFVNHIYIVTSGQQPKWLKAHPKITIVDHPAIFFAKSDLPTFNSHAIEANLHHIPGLSECYIYFNDDVFLGARVKRSDFFTKRGKPKLFFASWITPEGEVVPDDSAFNAAWKNSNALLNNLFGQKKRKALQHAPFVFKRSCQQSLENCMSSLFGTVSGHKFRSPADILLTAGFSQYYHLALGLAKKSKIESVVVGMIGDLEKNKRALAHIGKKRPKTFCIEDGLSETSPEQDLLLSGFLKDYFTEAAPWEQ